MICNRLEWWELGVIGAINYAWIFCTFSLALTYWIGNFSSNISVEWGLVTVIHSTFVFDTPQHAPKSAIVILFLFRRMSKFDGFGTLYIRKMRMYTWYSDINWNRKVSLYQVLLALSVDKHSVGSRLHLSFRIPHSIFWRKSVEVGTYQHKH